MTMKQVLYNASQCLLVSERYYYYHITNVGLYHRQDIFPQLEASGERAGREHDGRGVAGDDRRGGQRRRRRDFRGRVLAYHEENIAVLMRSKYYTIN